MTTDHASLQPRGDGRAPLPDSGRPPRRVLRRLVPLALAAALLGGGMSVAMPQTHAQAAQKERLCAYKGIFYQDGQWWSGIFWEPC